MVEYNRITSPKTELANTKTAVAMASVKADLRVPVCFFTGGGLAIFLPELAILVTF